MEDLPRSAFSKHLGLGHAQLTQLISFTPMTMDMQLAHSDSCDHHCCLISFAFVCTIFSSLGAQESLTFYIYVAFNLDQCTSRISGVDNTL